MKILLIFLDLYVSPLGFGILIKQLLDAGHELKILDIQNQKKAFQDAVDFHPDFIMASLYTGSHQRMLDFIKDLKESTGCLAFVGGPHPTFFPEVIDEFEFLDVICRGEGEKAVDSFFQAFEKNNDMPEAINNLSIRKGDRVFSNDLDPLEEDLDKNVFAERQLFYQTYPHMREYPVEWFMASRGCPFACSYCFNNRNHQIFGKAWKKVRYRSPQNLVEEIKDVMQYKKIDFIEFHDDMFGLKKDWLEKFAPLYRKEVGIPFFCNTIPSFINDEYIEKLAYAGLRAASMGIQIYDEKRRIELLNRPSTNKDIENGIKTLKKFNIKILTDTMLGLPTTTIEDDFKSLAYNRSLKVDYAWASIFQPYPKTDLAQYCIENGLWDGNVDALPSNLYLKTILNFPEKQKKQIFILQSFYSLTAKFYFIRPFVKFLFNFKPFAIYKIVPAFTQSYLLNFKIYGTKYKFKKIFRLIPMYIRRTFNRLRNIN